MTSCGNNSNDINLSLPEECCTANTGCSFNGSLRNVKAEPIYVQKVYDAALFNLQGLRTVANLSLSPALGRGARIIRVLDIRCKKFFNPCNIKDPKNLRLNLDTEISGGEFVKNEHGKEIRAVGPDGFRSQKLIFADTENCDDKCKGTPIFGTQNVEISGAVIVEIDVLFTDNCEKRCRATLTARAPVAPVSDPLVLTNFFELCIPSVYDGAFFPRFAEFCNVRCEPRLATNNIARDLIVNPGTGAVSANLLLSLCITCEKKIIVPVQLCVLSTGFPQLSAEISPICNTFPTLFPKQIDENSVRHCNESCSVQSTELDEEDAPLDE
ncbi:hypothetical protein [Clostridiisalibacter paucivorans]|uniref:hypothetical protein n=1 Tax=Clostridiisalibacter paucivorans TaxID=408753 RepID=UPI00047C1F39|nr:hypothetical protein [Clostridiisalibacter paucivorans]